MRLLTLVLKLCICVLAVELCSCALFKGDPAKDAGFIAEPERMSKWPHRVPFHKIWVSDKWLSKKNYYRRAIVAEVNTEHITKHNWWKALSVVSKDQLEEDSREIANYLRDTIIKTAKKDPARRVFIVDKSGPGTFVLKLALVELVPANSFLNFTSSVTGIFIPGAGLASSAGKGSIAIEGKLVDSRTGELLVTFKDREIDKSAPVNLASYTWYEGSKRNIEDWAEQMVEIMNTPLSYQVADSSPFTLSPW